MSVELMAFQGVPGVPKRLATFQSNQTCSHNTKASVSMSNLATKISAAGAATLIAATSLALPSFGEIISQPQCIKGEGPGCEEAARESPLIRGLLEKSRANREKNDKEMLEKWWMDGYSSYFSYGSNKKLTKGEDGKWFLADPDDPLVAAGRRMMKMVEEGKKANAGQGEGTPGK